MYDVIILGAGIAGATTALRLQELNTLVLEAESFVGGRTLSREYPQAQWANFGAQYFSDDKVNAFVLSDEVGVELIPLGLEALSGSYMPDFLDKDDVKQVREIIRRINEEQRQVRKPDDPALDQVSFKDWLGEVRPNVEAYWTIWCKTFSCEPALMSLYGVMLMHGMNRSTAFDEPVPSDPRGSCVLKGGMGALAVKVLERSSAPCQLNTTVTSISGSLGEGYTVRARNEAGETEFLGKRIVSTLPAPVVLAICDDLPEWKREALSTVAYNRMIASPVVIGPVGTGSTPTFEAAFRDKLMYCETMFGMRSPTDFDKDGGFFVSHTYDECSRELWDDSDESIQAGVYHQFQNTFPEYAQRVVAIDVFRWEYALPQYNLGRMGKEAALRKACDGIYFCGDYTDLSHVEGAIRSAERVVSEVRSDIQNGAGNEG